MRALRARIAVLLSLLVLLAPAFVAGRAQFFCRMLGRSLPACCCAARHAQAAAASEARTASPEASASDCCERLRAAARSGVVATRGAVQALPAAPIATLAPIAIAVVRGAPDVLVPSVRARAPPPLGPPLFLLHCAILS